MSSIHERFEINVPAQAVYDALSQPERIVGNLPGVSSIYRFERDRYRVDIGAAGRSDELDLEVDERVAPRHIAWHTRDGRWTGSVDVESLGESRSLVIVHVVDSQAAPAAVEAADNAAVVDAALRALKQALESAATEPAGGGAAAAAADDVHIRQRTRSDAEFDRGEDYERGGTEREGTERGGNEHAGTERARGERGEAGERAGADERWRGSRGLFRGGGDQAFAMMRSFSREMDKLWEQVMRRAAGAGRGTASFTGAWTPAIEICERDDVLRVCAEVPGVSTQELHVEIDPQLLVIRGERRSDNPDSAYARSERVYGAFVRRIPLPDGLRTEDARASLRNGVLEVRIPAAKLRRGRDVPVETADAERSV